MFKVYFTFIIGLLIFSVSKSQYPNFKDNPGLQETGKVIHEDKVLSGDINDLFDPNLKPFYHGVASGDPKTDGVIIWTKLTPDTEMNQTISWRIATDVNLSNVVNSGEVIAIAENNYSVSIDVDGLQPGMVYYYGFTNNNINSITGRTRTLPTGEVDRLRFALVTGSNYNWGYFNGYARIAERDDIFAVIHTGDYFYEYGKDYYFQPFLEGREAYPTNKCVTVDDYRGRFSQYRLDPDLRRVHQQHPMIAIWDDHEQANDSWTGGAEGHDLETDGSWEARRDNAVKVYYEWMPIRVQDPSDKKKIYRKFQFGDLLDLTMLEARIVGRNKQLAPKGEGDVKLNPIEWLNPSRTLLGEEQFNWAMQNLVTSQAEWKLFTSSVMMMQLFGFGYPVEGFGDDPVGNQDSWDGYPIERAKIFGAVLQNNIKNFGMLSGDFHTAFSSYLHPNPYNLEVNPVNPTEANPWPQFNKETGEGAIGFEFTTPSISTANLNEQNTFAGLPVFGLPERSPTAAFIESSVVGGNPHMVYTNTDQHGYTIIDLSKEKIQADWWFTTNKINEKPADTLYKAFPNLIRINTEEFSKGLYINSGEKKINEANQPMPNLENAPDPTPLDPPIGNSVESNNPNAIIISSYPNPAINLATISYINSEYQSITIKVFDYLGNQVALVLNKTQEPGVYGVEFDCSNLANGTYFYTLETKTGKITRSLLIQR